MKQEECYRLYDSSLGPITLAYTSAGISQLRFTREAATKSSQKDPSFVRETVWWLDTYFLGHDPGFIPQLDLVLTPFCRKVYALTMQIPYGTVATYSDIAKAIDPVNGQNLCRAVRQALARNPVLLLVPCHRVIKTGGLIGGYAAGEEIKRYLLKYEGIQLDM